MRPLLYMTLCFTMYGTILQAQEMPNESKEGNAARKKNAVYAEVGGVAYFISVNYERSFWLNNKSFIAWRAGLSPMVDIGTLSTAVMYNIGNGIDFFECGIGAGYYYGLDKSRQNDRNINFSYFTPVLGYRRSSKSGFLFKAYLSMLTLKDYHYESTGSPYYSTQKIYENKYYPFAGVSVGVAF